MPTIKAHKAALLAMLCQQPDTSLQARLADCERRFGSPAPALLGLRVRTPEGTGRVVQAFSDRLAVDLGQHKSGRAVLSFFRLGEVEIVQ